MSLTQPSSTMDWTVGNPNITTITVEPTADKKMAGWLPGEMPPAEFMNFLFNNTDAWVKYFRDKINSFAASYNAVIATDGTQTHTTLAAALADSAITSGARIFIKEDFGVSSVIQVTKNNIHLIFKNGVTYSKASASGALRITAQGVRIQDGRFTGFSATGNAAISIDSGSLYTRVQACNFLNNITDVADLNADTTTLITDVINEN